ncbi:MAG: phosphate signaling complex protein PhoU [Armatimonadota bacterium]|nr:phosphate signaling complex protein PhoU [Armatimonadota bacterium]MDR7500396.1 phosphate signaling complex protein PhoU [Armatimonadota bacterium]MDR7548040.1 phosphate signaling complex protein PhoU [Armatimonadota bacterium]
MAAPERAASAGKREPHIRESFDQALLSLEQDVLRMGRMAGDLIHRAVEAFTRRDAAMADSVVVEDDLVDALHFEVEQRVVQLLATQQPMAGDLRWLASVMAISIDLERLADHAEAIARAARRLDAPLLRPQVDIPHMEQAVQEMLSSVLQAFTARDAALAASVGPKDDTVDALRSQIFRELISYMIEDPRTVSRALELLIVAQHLERAADHITNVAERVIYIVTGELKEIND